MSERCQHTIVGSPANSQCLLPTGHEPHEHRYPSMEEAVSFRAAMRDEWADILRELARWKSAKDLRDALILMSRRWA